MKKSTGGKTYRVGVDVGGTFTDVVCLDEDGVISITKATSTPSDPATGVMDGIGNIDSADVSGERPDTQRDRHERRSGGTGAW